MTRESLPTTDLGHCLVTGAAGYVGRNLTRELVRRGHVVRGFDRRQIRAPGERLELVTGDVRLCDDVRKACEGIDTIFHTAAVLNFSRFATREEREQCHAINVDGVENVLRAAREAGVGRLVYTSTNNVTFGGPVLDGDEAWPYVKHPKDLYTETKVLGEKTVLAANGLGGLLTCAVRPGGIFGPGEERLLPLVVEQCARGRFVAVIGDGRARSDNTFIDNLVDGHIEAARHLAEGSPVCGQAYFVTDGAPINYFEFFRPLIEGMGFRFPRRRIPARPLYAAAWLWELLHWAIRVPPPPLTCLELRKVSVSHYNRIDKARRDFGWEPKVGLEEAWERSLAYCKSLLRERERREGRRAAGRG